MIYKFHAYSHHNVLATHKTTLEFTKDKEITLKGDCIVGVSSDFELSKAKEFISSLNGNKIKIIIKTPDNEAQETIEAEVNSSFNSDNELIMRKTDFASERTFAVKANKAAFELNRSLINYLKKEGGKVIVIFKPLNDG